jgi:hypothetical protein
MRDIVDRLRDYNAQDEEHNAYPPLGLIPEAADEIERLRGIMATCEWCGPDVGADQPEAALATDDATDGARYRFLRKYWGDFQTYYAPDNGEWIVEKIEADKDSECPNPESYMVSVDQAVDAARAADQQTVARKAALDELTRMAQEDGLYDGPDQQEMPRGPQHKCIYCAMGDMPSGGRHRFGPGVSEECTADKT